MADIEERNAIDRCVNCEGLPNEKYLIGKIFGEDMVPAIKALNPYHIANTNEEVTFIPKIIRGNVVFFEAKEVRKGSYYYVDSEDYYKGISSRRMRAPKINIKDEHMFRNEGYNE